MAKFGEIKSLSVKEIFIRRIEGMILSGELQPGERIPTERELAEEMKISKTAVHDGLAELKRLGFLDVASRKGITVADYATTGNVDTLLAILSYQGNQMDIQTGLSILDVRFFIEAPALLALANERTEDDILELEKTKAWVETQLEEDDDAFAHAIYVFHRKIMLLTKNQITPLLMNAFLQPGMIFWKGYVEEIGRNMAIQRLEQYLEYIRLKNGDAAVELLRVGIEHHKSMLREGNSIYEMCK